MIPTSRTIKAVKRCLFLLAAIFLVSGCSLRQAAELKGASVTVHTKSEPLKINGGSTEIATADLDSVPGMAINMATGRVESTGNGSDVLKTYRADAVAIPPDIADAVDVGVEAINFKAEFPTPEESHNMAIIIGNGVSEVAFATEVVSGSNTISVDLLPADTWNALNDLLKNSSDVDIAFYIDGNPATISLGELSIAAVLKVGTHS